MLHFNVVRLKSMFLCLGAIAIAVPTMAAPEREGIRAHGKGIAVAYPWMFQKGTPTSRETAIATAEEIARKAGYEALPGDAARAAWASTGHAYVRFGNPPTRALLKAFGKAAHATKVVYGSVSWHTRSIWVNLGPKTISTATVNVYVFDVSSGMIIYKAKGVRGRSDEPSNGWKIAADVILSPLVTAVSGGPKTPHEQRAVQIALGKAYRDWVRWGVTSK